jgi:PAS domain S-box-containing protein
LYTDDGQAYLKGHAITDISWSEESRKVYENFANERGLEFYDIRGLWGTVILTGEPVLANDPPNDPRGSGLPVGHPPLHSFLGLPFHSEGKIIGMAGIANRPGGYDTELVDFLGPYVITCANIIEAYRIEKRRREAQEHLVQAHAELHQKVQERTAELHLANDRLVLEVKERERAQQAEAAERQRLYDVLETLPVYVCLLDQDYRMPFANRYFRETFGESRGRRCHDFLFNRTEPCEICETYTVMKTRAPHHWYWTGPNGRDYDIYDFPFTERDGSFRILEMGIDITERNQIERALRESESRYRALYEGSADGIFLFDDNGTILDGNEASLRMYGYSLEEIRGTKIVDLIDPDDLNAIPFRFQEILRGEILRIERRVRKRDGTYLPVEVSARRVGENLVQGLYRDITERKESEEIREKALETAEILGKMFSTTHFSVVFFDKDFNFIQVNQAYADVCGYPPEFFPGKNHFDLYPHPENESIFRRVVETGETFTVYAKPFEFPDDPDRGTTYWDWTLHPVKDSQGQVEGLIFVLLDVTERKRVEEERACGAKEIEDLYNYAPCGYHSLDSEGVFVRINDTELSWLGYAREEVVGKKKFQDIITTESLKNFHENYPVLKERGWVRDLEFDIVRKDGTILPVLLNSTAVRASSGDYVMSRSTMFDNTERKRAEHALQIASAYNRSLIEASLDPLITISDEGKITDVNTAMERVTGCSRNELVGNDFAGYFTDPSRARTGYQQVFRDGSVKNYELAIRHKGGHVTPVMYNASVYRDDSGKVVGIFAAARDITDRKRAEENLTRSNEDLQQFAYVASHDLQEPLRNVTSCLQMLEKKYGNKLGSDADQYIHYAVEGAVRMKDLILDLLAYSRIRTTGKTTEPTDVEQILAETLRNLKSGMTKTGAIVTHDCLPTIHADDTQLLQVFQNLIGNAIKFRREEIPRIHVSAARNKDEWTFSVKDNGIGIEARHLDRIFVIFERLHKRSQYEGTGMGLAIVKKIIERHGGRVWVESAPGHGTTFYFTMPDRGIQI